MSVENILTGASWRTEDFDTNRYLQLLGLGPERPSLEFLEQLHTRHVYTFPFCAVDGSVAKIGGSQR